MLRNKVLYAEDEPVLAQIITEGLKNSGYDVLHKANGEEAIKLFESITPDICVIDVMMPLKDGYTLAQEIRIINPNIPIIFLSAKSVPEDIIKGFKSGGHDYLKKPFNMGELLIRMESLLVRFYNSSPAEVKATSYQFGKCILNVKNHELTNSSGNYKLSFKEVALLEMLILNKNDILPRQDALISIWGDNSHYNSRSMDVFMAHLRKMLKDESGIEILSLRGVGYKLVC
jgi:DNA-binding response OmpR family regulator